jgi:hypothetical protein
MTIFHRLPQPGGPGLRIDIQDQGGLVTPPNLSKIGWRPCYVASSQNTLFPTNSLIAARLSVAAEVFVCRCQVVAVYISEEVTIL